MMPSRPNGVLNHGTPAYTYGPVGMSLVIIWMSAADRLHHSLNCSLAVNRVHHSRAPPRTAAGGRFGRLVVRPRGTVALRALAPDRQRQRVHLVRRELEVKPRMIAGHGGGRRIEQQHGGAQGAVEPFVRQPHRVRIHRRREQSCRGAPV